MTGPLDQRSLRWGIVNIGIGGDLSAVDRVGSPKAQTGFDSCIPPSSEAIIRDHEIFQAIVSAAFHRAQFDACAVVNQGISFHTNLLAFSQGNARAAVA